MVEQVTEQTIADLSFIEDDLNGDSYLELLRPLIVSAFMTSNHHK